MPVKRILLVSSNTTTDPFPVYPLGLAILAGALVREGHLVDQLDFLAEGRSEDAFRTRLAAFAPDYVCISIRNLDNCDSRTATLYPVVARRLVELTREGTSAPVIIGGPAFSIMPEELLAFTKADYGVIGEGERVLCGLIRDLALGRTPPRIQQDGALIPGPEQGAPLYTADLVAFYRAESGMVNVQSKRGCPHACTYCSYPVLEGRNYRFREPEAVIADLERAHRDFGADMFFFTDSVFNDAEGNYLKVAEAMARRQLPVKWCCYMRPQGFGRAEVALLKRAGLYAVELGTDAACDTTLREMGKGFTFREAWEVNAAFQAEGVPCAHFVMFGGPGETAATLEEGLANLETLEHTVVFAFSGIRVLPGTSLHKRAVREGVLAQDGPMLEPVFYQSPLLDTLEMTDRIEASFHGRRDRVFPPETTTRRLEVLRRAGFRGLLWETVLDRPARSRA